MVIKCDHKRDPKCGRKYGRNVRPQSTVVKCGHKCGRKMWS